MGNYKSVAVGVCMAAGTLGMTANSIAAPFEYVRIGDIDGFGYGIGLGFSAAPPGPANVDGLNVLQTGDFLPDLNNNTVLATGNGDDFDNRSAAEVSKTSVQSVGATVNTPQTTGSEYTDISLSTSYDNSQSANTVFNANTGTYGAGGAFPGDGNPSSTAGNQPGFVFDFFVATGDIVSGTQVFFNLVFGDYDVVPASVKFTRANGSTFTQAVATQPGGQDGLIQSAFSGLNFVDVFTAVTGGFNGFLKVDFVAGNEPYTAFDYVELNVEPIALTQAPEPASLALLGLGLAGLGFSRRRKA